MRDIDRKKIKKEVARILRGGRGVRPSPDVVVKRLLASIALADWPKKAKGEVVVVSRMVKKLDSFEPLAEFEKRVDWAFRFERCDSGDVYWRARAFSLSLSVNVESWLRSDADIARMPCFFCARAACNLVKMPDSEMPEMPMTQTLHVCSHHSPGTPGWRRAKRLVAWAGGIGPLGERYGDATDSVRSGDVPLPAASGMEGMKLGPDSDWQNHAAQVQHTGADPLALPDSTSYAAGRTIVYSKFLADAMQARAEGGRRGGVMGGLYGHLGGRPRQVSEATRRKIRILSEKGHSQAKIAARLGLSHQHVSRILKS